MTYSTCTLNPEENEAVVRYALDTYPCLRLVPAEPRVGGPGTYNTRRLSKGGGRALAHSFIHLSIHPSTYVNNRPAGARAVGRGARDGAAL